MVKLIFFVGLIANLANSRRSEMIITQIYIAQQVDCRPEVVSDAIKVSGTTVQLPCCQAVEKQDERISVVVFKSDEQSSTSGARKFVNTPKRRRTVDGCSL